MHRETFPEKRLREEETRLLTCKSWQVLALVFARKGNRYRLLPTEQRSLLSTALRLLSDSHPPRERHDQGVEHLAGAARAVAHEGNPSEQLEESLYLQTETAQFDFRDCLYTRLFSLGHAVVKDKKIQLACLLKSRAIAKDCHYGSTFSLENTEGIATSWTNPGLSAEINDLKEWYFPKVRYKN